GVGRGRLAVEQAASQRRIRLGVDADHRLHRVVGAAGARHVDRLAPRPAQDPAITLVTRARPRWHRPMAYHRCARPAQGRPPRPSLTPPARRGHTGAMSRPPRSGTGDGAEGVAPAPAEVTDYAAQAVEYVRRALGVT